MRWPTHQAGAFACSLLTHLPPIALGAALAGAILPDMLDQRLAGLAFGRRAKQRVFNRIHRGSTHWFGWWIALLLFAPSAGAVDAERQILAGLAIGALSHVALDMLTPRGVPLLPFFSGRLRVGIPLCSTGSLAEYVFLAVSLGLCGYLLFFPV